MKETKKTYYVCAGVYENKLKFLKTEACNKIDAINNFIIKYNFSPEEVSGPFIFRRENSKRKLTNVKFSTKTYKSLYNDWNVIITELVSPDNYVYIMYDSHISDNNLNKPESEIMHIKNVIKS